jgi:hypothetical protein|tara:strand:- start:502 stop:858 length:357 start_codon:yes stop_codon:yes gene_type:complete
MARYNRLQGGGPDRTQNSTQDGLDALERSALGPASRNGAPQASNGSQTERRPIPEGKPTLIPHKLGRPYRGWNVAMKNKGESFFCPSGESYDKSKYICVQWDDSGAGYDSVDAEFWVY